MNKNKKLNTKVIVGTGLLAALSSILYIFVKFPLPIFPSFLEIQISELPLLICGFAFGPLPAIIATFIKTGVKLAFSSSILIGELSDLIITLPLILITSLIYKRKKSFKRALLSFIIGSIISTGIAVLSNRYIIVPLYVDMFYEGNWNAIAEACSMIKGLTIDNFFKYYLLLGVIPFNLFRYIIVGLFTFPLYKRTHRLLDKMFN